MFFLTNYFLQFFSKKGVPNVQSAEDLFIEITGCSYFDRVSLETLKEALKMKPHLVDKPGIESSYNFETAWAKSQAEKLAETQSINDVDQFNLAEAPKA